MANAQFFQYTTIQKLFVLTGVVSIILILAATNFVKYVPIGRQERYLTSANEFYSLLGRDSTIKHKPVLQVHCKKLGEENVTEKAEILVKNEQDTSTTEQDLLQNTLNCDWVRDYFNNFLYTTKLEKSFPIAFAFLVHNNSQQVMKLLKLLYRPHNQYCIAPDLKSNTSFITTFRNIAKCLDNIYVASKLIEIRWGHKSIMESQMQCYRDLLWMHKNQTKVMKWRYVINLCGKELPLASNYEIVSHLVKLNGTSAIGARKIPSTETGTYSRLRKQSIPYSLPLYKSMTYMCLSYKFINFLMTNRTAIQLYKFFLTCKTPEEHFYATAYMIPNVPGGYNPKLPRSYYFTTDNYFWRRKEFMEKNGKQCSGIIVHNICIVSIGDLKRVLLASNNGKSALFHNKYFMEYDHLIMTCMEERIRAKNILEYIEDN